MSEDNFPTTDEEIEAFMSDPNNKATPEEMLEFFYEAHPKLIIRCAEAEKDCKRKDEQIAVMKSALEFYGNENNYKRHTTYMPKTGTPMRTRPIVYEEGCKARQALVFLDEKEIEK